MTQPSFVPIGGTDQVRPALRLEPPRPWTARRPAEVKWPARPGGRQLGTPGPDQGFAFRLARRFEDRLHLAAGESAEDAMVGCALLAARRAAVYGRAPTVHDVRAAYSMWGFLGDAPTDLVALRRRVFSGASHDYVVQRAVVDRVPEDVLRTRPDELAARVAAGEWRSLVGAAETE